VTRFVTVITGPRSAASGGSSAQDAVSIDVKNHQGFECGKRPVARRANTNTNTANIPTRKKVGTHHGARCRASLPRASTAATPHAVKVRAHATAMARSNFSTTPP